MKIWMPTSNGYLWAAEASAKLLHKYWPSHPPVDVCHFEEKPEINLPGFRLVDLGCERDLPYVARMIEYLERHNADETVLLCLDDYGLCQPVDGAKIVYAKALMHVHPRIASFALTWQPCQGKTPWNDKGDICEFPRWAWAMNTQGGIWRREHLLRILRAVPPHLGIWELERACSDWFNALMWPQGYRMIGWNCPDPPKPSDFVDGTDKTLWPCAYHNLAHQGTRDHRHDEFLRKEGLL